MQAGPSPAREARLRHRHGVRTLTYVTLDQGNGGILLNVTRGGAAVQSVAAVRTGQQVQVRFDLLAPRVRVNAHGEVIWATSSGRCGIRFLDLTPTTAFQLDQWIFAKLLEGLSPLSPPGSMFATVSRQPTQAAKSPRIDSLAPGADDKDENLEPQRSPEISEEAAVDNLIISPGPVTVIDLPHSSANSDHREAVPRLADLCDPAPESPGKLDRLSQPLSGRRLAWTVNTLVVIAAWLLSVLVFLTILREIPKWPTAMVTGAAIVVAGLYWGFCRTFAGSSLGARLARLSDSPNHSEDPEENRFR